jgi:aspartyl-tRNA(Asn)/glutamyl-tRNA(Gln) amidotransferase subunit A
MLGHQIVDVSLPHTAAAVPTYYVIASAEASTNLARYDGVRYGYRCADPKDLTDLYERSRSEGFGSEVKRRILTGTYALSIGYYDAYYLQAQRVRRLIRDDFLQVFAGVDALLAPTTPDVAFPIGHISDPIEMYQQDVFTVPASLAGIPALALPCGFQRGLPVGMQLMGAHFSDVRLLGLGAAFQRETDWHRRTALPE